MSRGKMTRRRFLESSAAFVLGGQLAGCKRSERSGKESQRNDRSGAEKNQHGAKSRVVLVRRKDVFRPNGTLDRDVLGRMVDEGVTRLLGVDSASEAWARLFGAADTVGIKSNVWRFLPTPPELEEILVARVVGAGVDASRIAVDDRGVLRNPIFQKATALLNVRPLRTHHWSGVGGCIKNYIMFSESPPAWHDDSCADLGGLWKLPAVAGKTRLNVLVMLTPLFHGKGPHHFHPRYTWNYGGLLFSTDPVAVDATGIRILEAKRRRHFGKDEPFSTPVKHVRLAQERHGIGVADPERIELVFRGDREGSLI